MEDNTKRDSVSSVIHKRKIADGKDEILCGEVGARICLSNRVTCPKCLQIMQANPPKLK